MPSTPIAIQRETIRLLAGAALGTLALGLALVACLDWVLGSDARYWRDRTLDLALRDADELVGQHVRTASDLVRAVASRGTLRELVRSAAADGRIDADEAATLSATAARVIAEEPDTVGVWLVDRLGRPIAAAGAAIDMPPPLGDHAAAPEVIRLGGEPALVVGTPIDVDSASGVDLALAYRLQPLRAQFAAERANDRLVREVRTADGGVVIADDGPLEHAVAMAVPGAPLVVRVGLTLDEAAHSRHVRSQEIAWLMAGMTVLGSAGVVLLLQPMTARINRQSAELERRRDESQRLADELGRSNAELEQFALFASHDLQEPLRMVTSFLGLLQRQFAAQLPDKARGFIGQAVDGAARMRDMIGDLLAYARVDRGGGERIAIPLERPLATALRALAAAIADTGAIIEQGPLATVLADERQIAQVLQNLVGNAIKYHGERAPMVRIDASATGDGLVAVRIADNGRGVLPDERARIFELFQRGSSSAATSGTGIGLAICAKIVARHGGTIRVDGDPGGGAVFVFTLPAAPTAP